MFQDPLTFRRVKMYKTHITQWGLDKKNKDFEMRAIVRKNKERSSQGKRSIIRIRGQTRDFAEVIRYWKRKGVSIDDMVARQTASPTPEAVEFFTPVPSPILTPQVLAIPERIFRCVRDYFRGSFDSGTWVRTEPLYACYSNRDEGDFLGAEKLLFECHFACSLFSRNLFEEAGQTLIAATAEIKNILLIEDPETLSYLLWLLVDLRNQKRDEMALIIIRHFYELSQVLLGSEHPLSRICEWIASVYTSSFEDVVAGCMRNTVDEFESSVGPLHQSTLSSRLNFFYVIHQGSDRIQMMQKLLGECEKTLRPHDIRTSQVRGDIACEYFGQSNYVEAKTLIQDNIACSQQFQPVNDPRLLSQYQDLYVAARCHYALGEVDLGIETLRRLINSMVSEWGPQDSHARYWLVILEDWYLEQGRWSSAAQVRHVREKALESMNMD